MLQHWFIITVSWFGSVSLQYINTGGLNSDVGFDMMEGPHYSMSNVNFGAPQMKTEFPLVQMDPLTDQIYQRDGVLSEKERKRRSIEEQATDADREKRWISATPRLNGDKTRNTFMTGFAGILDENATANEILDSMLEKKYFSPWGGKRGDTPAIEHMWTWKRSKNLREPSMPKRVRFSPWGGKRSGQMVFKPGSKSSKIIFSTSIPELTRIVSNYSPNGKRVDFAGFQFSPISGKMHPVKILTMSTNERIPRDALPYKSFFDGSFKFFRPGHPYIDVNLKKDGKRKVKFSAWGGKRSPPIIGPIWTPASNNIKDVVKAIFLVGNRYNQDKNEHTMM